MTVRYGLLFLALMLPAPANAQSPFPYDQCPFTFTLPEGAKLFGRIRKPEPNAPFDRAHTGGKWHMDDATIIITCTSREGITTEPNFVTEFCSSKLPRGVVEECGNSNRFDGFEAFGKASFTRGNQKISEVSILQYAWRYEGVKRNQGSLSIHVGPRAKMESDPTIDQMAREIRDSIR